MWVSVPFVPDTLTVWTPALPVQDRVEVPDVPRVIVGGFKEQESPIAGEADEESVIGPANPFVAETVIIEVPVAFASVVTLDGLAVMLKSASAPMLYVTMTE